MQLRDKEETALSISIPEYYKTTLSDVENCVKSARKAISEVLCKSPGGREIYLLRYGEKNDLSRSANLSSALGARDISCFADKTKKDYRPVLLLVGTVHGGEFEGTAALLNLIQIMETGRDYAGNEHNELEKIMKSVTLLIIPCLNPDGRAHIPFNSFVGKSFNDLRYYNQGTWKDGTLCGWPECKKIHPIRDFVDYLGGYYNDNGINLMHDDFFGKKSVETEKLLWVCEEYAPDFSVLLHGGANCRNVILNTAYSSGKAKEIVCEAERRIKEKCDERGLEYNARMTKDCGENSQCPASFNLASAMHQVCGEPCVTYESNQGLIDNGEIGRGFSYDEIYNHHLILFSELAGFISEKYSMKGEAI